MSDSIPNFEGMSASSIEELLERTRTEMSATLAQLSEVAHPKYQAAQAKIAAQRKAEEYKAEAQHLWERAKAGDTEAIKRLAILGGVSVAVISVMIYRIVHRHR